MSVIIPTLNEESYIGRLLEFLTSELSDQDEIIVVDGGSMDKTKDIITQYPVQLLESEISRRSTQLNLGASQAKTSTLYFIHADALPPNDFKSAIHRAIQNKADCGCFSYRFDRKSPLLAFNELFTQFPNGAVGGGDQTLYIKKSIFNQIGGFDEQLILMEDFEMTRKIRKKYHYKIIRKDVIISARKYTSNSWLRVQCANMLVFTAFKLGASQTFLKNAYQRILKD